MRKATSDRRPANRSLPKAPTGIQGLDEITGGGVPPGRPTLVCGSAGCGKTLLAMEFLIRGAYSSEPYGPIMAGAPLSALPLLIVFLLANRRIVEGMCLGGVKGCSCPGVPSCPEW